MRELQYKDFSRIAHKKNLRKGSANICQLELTYRCNLHCRHCYTDCFNHPRYLSQELKTKEVISIISKLSSLGVLWLCFTGGDPLMRKDFLEIYAYAKKSGFLITIFTSGCALSEEVAKYLARHPPFVMEVTLNARDKKTYEEITGVRGSYRKAMKGLDLILKNNLPLKVKTLASRQNYAQLPDLKAFLEEKNLRFRPDTVIHARLNGDKGPCKLRLRPKEIFALEKLSTSSDKEEEQVDSSPCAPRLKKPVVYKGPLSPRRVFPCVAGSLDGMFLNPYGKMFFCHCLRKPEIDFLASTAGQIEKVRREEFARFSEINYKTESKCSLCRRIEFCVTCPGKRFLETGNLESPVRYFCRLAEALEKRARIR